MTGVSPATAAGLCATPGNDGAGGVLSGVVNTYYPGVGTAAAGDGTVDVGGSSGAAAAIAAGDLLLVIQMQDADFDSSNTNAYGHGGAPASPASGYTALNATGRYEYVRATSGCGRGTVSIEGLGAGNGLLYGVPDRRRHRSGGPALVPGRSRAPVHVGDHLVGLTALAWNGSVGGVLALDATGALTLAGTVSVDGLGFRVRPGSAAKRRRGLCEHRHRGERHGERGRKQGRGDRRDPGDVDSDRRRTAIRAGTPRGARPATRAAAAPTGTRGRTTRTPAAAAAATAGPAVRAATPGSPTSRAAGTAAPRSLRRPVACFSGAGADPAPPTTTRRRRPTARTAAASS